MTSSVAAAASMAASMAARAKFRASPATVVRFMGGAANPRRRLSPAMCSDWISELNQDERTMLYLMLKKDLSKNQRGDQLRKVRPDGEGPAPFAAAALDPVRTATVQSAENGATPAGAAPTPGQLYGLALHQALPFVGFGFLDNLIMIVAGEYIDAHIGVALGISTMAAAGLGNALSDVFGIGSAWYVEHWASKLGICNAPALSLEQLELRACRITINAGRALGVFVGCLLGMFPLLFSRGPQKDKDDDGDKGAGVVRPAGNAGDSPQGPPKAG